MVEPTSFDDAVMDAIGTLRDASTRFPVERTGQRAPISAQVRLLVLLRDQFRCDWCGSHHPGQLFHLDHIVPWSAGGGDDTSNLRILCPDCNERRSNFRTDTGYTRRMACTPMCRPCFADGSTVADFTPTDVELAFCASCRRVSWITTHDGWCTKL